MEAAASDEVLLISGSSRSNGDTSDAIRLLSTFLPLNDAAHIELRKAPLRHFDYERTAERDEDFDTIIARILTAKAVVLATPVYWYSMSALMKVFFDRLTDLILDPTRKQVARALANRDLWLLAVGAEPNLPPGFTQPFELTARYLQMRYRGHCYLHYASHPTADSERRAAIEKFARHVASCLQAS